MLPAAGLLPDSILLEVGTDLPLPVIVVSYGTLSALLPAGMLIGGLLWGPMGDALGAQHGGSSSSSCCIAAALRSSSVTATAAAVACAAVDGSPTLHSSAACKVLAGALHFVGSAACLPSARAVKLLLAWHSECLP